MHETAKATPAKEFFIHMITKDLSIQDCILDLLDNSIDGALRHKHSGPRPLEGFWSDIRFDATSFSISDNCGGIPLDAAKNYAFNFGRRKGAPAPSDHSIGLYGIGMKRAMFKIGREIIISSSTASESISLAIDVPKWEAIDEWDFDMEVRSPAGSSGTQIEVLALTRGIGREFQASTFATQLFQVIGRDYSLFIQKGLEVKINGNKVSPLLFSLRESPKIIPARFQYADDGVSVEIWAGMAAPPPDDDSAGARIPNADRYGWYVFCNDRVVVAADKTDKTVWGDGKFPSWHPQYNGFLGIVAFTARNPAKLPWTTTKRDVDAADPLYRRAVAKMQKLTRTFINYTTERKGDLATAKRIEDEAVAKPLSEIREKRVMAMPRISPIRNVAIANILYQKPKADVLRAAEALGNPSMYAKDVGLGTFAYFWKREVED